MRNPEGESNRIPLRPCFDRRLKLDFHGSRITSDAGLLAYRELDDALDLTESANDAICDHRTGKNGGVTATPTVRMAAWDTGRRRRKRSLRQAGRPAPLRSAGHPAWRRNRRCTNIRTGPASGGGSGAGQRFADYKQPLDKKWAKDQLPLLLVPRRHYGDTQMPLSDEVWKRLLAECPTSFSRGLLEALYEMDRDPDWARKACKKQGKPFVYMSEDGTHIVAEWRDGRVTHDIIK